ncbi:hypothetical protein Taro_046329 [Colocasia esculenta]|uniref:Uncharacterized protein n=1 Tax=Colocasia esculenta TaxID=4460 RepID=A0A843X5Z9_COLES|nr:hypothetical protein [Colocasia esculenta]
MRPSARSGNMFLKQKSEYGRCCMPLLLEQRLALGGAMADTHRGGRASVLRLAPDSRPPAFYPVMEGRSPYFMARPTVCIEDLVLEHMRTSTARGAHHRGRARTSQFSLGWSGGWGRGSRVPPFVNGCRRIRVSRRRVSPNSSSKGVARWMESHARLRGRGHPPGRWRSWWPLGRHPSDCDVTSPSLTDAAIRLGRTPELCLDPRRPPPYHHREGRLHINPGEERSRWITEVGGQPIVQRNRTAVRKLLRATDDSDRSTRTLAPAPGAATEERMGEDGCSRDDVAVYQGETPPLPNGIPTYTVEILNVCVSGCVVSDIHVSCGWFSSARLINPRIFRRVGFDDCLVNDGAALPPGGSVSFQYANTYRYPLYVSSLACGTL